MLFQWQNTYRESSPPGHGRVGGRLEEVRCQPDGLQLVAGERERFRHPYQRDIVRVRLCVKVRMNDKPFRGYVAPAGKPIRAANKQLHIREGFSGDAGSCRQYPAPVHDGTATVHQPLVDEGHLKGKLSVGRILPAGNPWADC